MTKKFTQTKYISLVLENCDEIVIDMNDIDEIEFQNVYETLKYFDNDVQKIYQTMRVAKSFTLVLKESANKTHHQFGGMTNVDGGKEPTVFERITEHHDITAVKLLDKNYKDLDYIFVEYIEKQPGALGAPNILEKTTITKDEFTHKDICLITIKDE